MKRIGSALRHVSMMFLVLSLFIPMGASIATAEGTSTEEQSTEQVPSNTGGEAADGNVENQNPDANTPEHSGEESSNANTIDQNLESNTDTGTGNPDAETGGDSTESAPASLTPGDATDTPDTDQTVIATHNVTGTVTDANTGDPIMGAVVSIDGSELTATSGPDGTYAIADVPAGDQTFQFNANGYDTMPLSVVVDAEHSMIDAALMPTMVSAMRLTSATYSVTITGVTSDGGSAEGATIFISDVNADFADVASGTLDVNNQFTAEVPSGSYYVHIDASRQGYYLSETRFTVAEAPTTLTMALEPGQGYYAVTGTVIEIDTGDPIAGATVTIAGTQLTTTTDADGAYIINQVRNGYQTFVFSAAGYKTLSVTRNVYSGSENVPDVALTPEGDTTFAVTVNGVTADGGSVAGALIEITDASRVVVEAGTLDAYNQFAVGELPNGDYLVTIDANWDGFNTVPFTVDNAPVTVDVALSRGQFSYAVTGTVTEAGTGDPIPDATVTVAGTQLTATTDADGRYVISPVPEGRQTFVFNAADHEPVTATRDISYRFFPFNAVLAPGGATTFTVTINGVTSDGGSAAGALVEIFDATRAVVAAGTLDANNRFSANVINGDYFVMIEGKRQGYLYHERSFAIAGAPLTVDISLNLGSKYYVVTGTVTDAVTGAPIDGATVSIQSIPWAVDRTDSSGAYIIEDVWGGEYTFDFTAPGYYFLSQDVSIGDNSFVFNAELTPFETSTAVTPEDPTVTQAVRTDSGEVTPPSVTPATTEGIVYLTTGTVAPGNTVTVTATPKEDYVLASASGWTLHEDGTATFSVKLDPIKNSPLVDQIIQVLIRILREILEGGTA